MSIGKVSNGFCIGRGYRLARVSRDLILAGGGTNQLRRLTQPWAQAFLHQTACVSITGWHICSMTVLFRCRVDPRLLKRAAKVTQELGTSLPEAVRIFVAQVARTGSVPVSLSTKSGREVLVNKAARDAIMRSLDDTETW